MSDNRSFVTDFIDESRTAEQCRELEDWLHADPQHVAEFVDSLLVHNDLKRFALAADLSSYQSGGAERPQHDALLQIIESVAAERALCDLDNDFSKASSPSWRALVAIGLAASLLIAAIGYYVASRPSMPTMAMETAPVTDAASKQENDSVPEAEAMAVAATFSDAQKCVWDSLTETMAFGQLLKPGSIIALQSGVAQLTFETGAVLLAEGPCRLIVQDNAVELSRGRVTATVPRQASGFAVTTPTSRVIDLGTEIGVDVGTAGDTEVHVFNGEVVSCQLDQSGNPVGDFVRLTANDAIAFRRGTYEAMRFAANEAAFVRHLSQNTTGEPPRTSPVEGQLQMWFAADHDVLRDGADGVIAWRDSLTSAANLVADNALQPVEQFRPRFIQAAIGGRPALMFDGVDDCLVTTPIATGDSQTIVFVATLAASSGDGGQLLNYNGPPQIMENRFPQLGVLQIRACRMGDQGLPLFDPYVYVKNLEEEFLFVGRMEQAARDASVTQNLPSFDEPVVGVYIYRYETNRAGFYLNGMLIGESTAPLPAAITSRKVIGRHGGWRRYFAGMVAEMMIFDEGLEDERVLAITRSLGDKYGIKVE